MCEADFTGMDAGEYYAMRDYKVRKGLKRVDMDYMMKRLMAEIHARDGIWYDRNKVPHKIKEMSTSHILNCLNMMKNNRPAGYEYYIKAFEKELDERGKDQ